MIDDFRCGCDYGFMLAVMSQIIEITCPLRSYRSASLMSLDTRLGNGETGFAPVQDDSYSISCCITACWSVGGCSHLGHEVHCSSNTEGECEAVAKWPHQGFYTSN